MTPLRTVRLAAVLTALAAGSAAHAQHAGFVLFGEPSEGASSVPETHRFVHPMTSPYFHEDSFVTTDLRGYFLYHDFPSGGVINGGTAKVYALQARLAILNCLQLVAYKDGYTDFDAGLLDDSGWNDVGAGLKWNFIQNWEQQFHMAAGVGYELPVGDPGVLQNDDEIRLWASVNKGFDRLHLGGTFNYFFADDGSEGLGNSDYLSWHAHADYYVHRLFSPVVELNGYHVVDEGTVVLPFSGIDVTNLGGGDDVITIGFGGEARPIDRLALRVAYETPLTNGEDLYGYRITCSAVFSF